MIDIIGDHRDCASYVEDFVTLSLCSAATKYHVRGSAPVSQTCRLAFWEAAACKLRLEHCLICCSLLRSFVFTASWVNTAFFPVLLCATLRERTVSWWNRATAFYQRSAQLMSVKRWPLGFSDLATQKRGFCMFWKFQMVYLAINAVP